MEKQLNMKDTVSSLIAFLVELENWRITSNNYAQLMRIIYIMLNGILLARQFNILTNCLSEIP